MGRVGCCRLSEEGVKAVQSKIKASPYSGNVRAFCRVLGVAISHFYKIMGRKHWSERETIEDFLIKIGVKDGAEKNERYYDFKDYEPKPHNLPLQTTSFVGRKKEIDEIKTLLETTRLLTLTGSGGCGKTRLALQVAADLLDAYPNGVWLAELAPLSELAPLFDPAFVVSTVASALGLHEEPDRTLIQTLNSHLESKTLLLVLDNCEHLVEACASLTDTLLRSCPKVKIVATSRETLNIPGETVWRVPSLLLPNPDDLPAAEEPFVSMLAEYDAVRLFVERARSQRSDFRLNRLNGLEVAEVCRRLDGIPLAIELAAAQIRALSVAKIAKLLDDRFDLLTGGSRTALPRHQTLKAMIDWSYDLLEGQEQLLFRRLSVFVGGWTLDAAEEVCGGESIEAKALRALMTALVDKSLVIVEEGDEEYRYRLLGTIRQYAQQRLAEAGEANDLKGRHRDHFLAFAEEAEAHLQGAEQAEWLYRLEEEHENLQAGLDWSLAEVGSGEGLRLCAALSRFWWTRGHLSEGREWCVRMLGKPGTEARTLERANAFSGAGVLASHQGDHASAQAYHQESLVIRRELGDRSGIAMSLNNLGSLANDRDDHASAQAYHQESLAIRRELGDRSGIAMSLMNLGSVVDDLGDYALAQTYLEESLTFYREIKDRGGIAAALNMLGSVVYKKGDYALVQTYLEESLTLYREIGGQTGIADIFYNLGDVAYAQKEDARALAYHQKSLAIYWEIGDGRGVAYSLEACAELKAAQKQTECAARLWGAVEAWREKINSPLPPDDQEEYQRNVAGASQNLSPEAFSVAWDTGRAMPLEQAIQLALETSDA